MEASVPVTRGTLLQGAIAYCQPQDGFRTGIEPVLLAAAIPAKTGDRVLEAGTGPGAGLLCLAHRIPGIAGTGVEQAEEIAALARDNLHLNHLEQVLNVITMDIVQFSRAMTQQAGGAPASYDHVFANPPWHDEDGTPSPMTWRDQAKRRRDGLLGQWARALASLLRPRGTISLIVPAALFSETAAELRTAGIGAIALCPLWPKAGRAAKIVILQGIKAGKGADRVMPGLILHEDDGRYTAQADAILRNGAAWPLR